MDGESAPLGGEDEKKKKKKKKLGIDRVNEKPNEGGLLRSAHHD